MAKIYLTAGHHKKDSGAVGNGYQENNLTVELRDLVTAKLKELHPNLKVWNDNDNDTLSQVITKINADGVTSNDFLLEIHFDSAENNKAMGSTALVANDARDRSRNFAKDIVTNISEVMKTTNRGVKTEADSHRGRLGVLHTKANSCLIEICFINNAEDIKRYQDNKNKVVEEIAIAIIKHVC